MSVVGTEFQTVSIRAGSRMESGIRPEMTPPVPHLAMKRLGLDG